MTTVALTLSLSAIGVICGVWISAIRPVHAGADRGYSPCARAMISLEIDSGTWLYEWNCIVYVARPWVRERRSVE
jgi:hypothetical protein